MKEIFELQWKDNVKGRILDASLSNEFVKPGKKEKKEIRSQIEVYNLIKRNNEKNPEK
jgi:hypothetical protein